MIIDFHTHIFPENIAPHAIHSLESENRLCANGTATLTGIREEMKNSHVDYSVILPVVTNPSQFDSINRYAIEINQTEGIISFGGIHPDNEDIDDKLKFIKKSGLKGVKLHPDYQGPTYIDDLKYIKIIKKCIELDLCVVIHAGMDVGRPIPIHCPPDHAYLMLKEVLTNCPNDSKIVLAHMGGMMQWDLVEQLLVGKNVYFDFAYCNILGSQEQMLRIIKKHGANRILFGTDFPWTSQSQLISYINQLPLTREEKECIFYKNAKKLLEL